MQLVSLFSVSRTTTISPRIIKQTPMKLFNPDKLFLTHVSPTTTTFLLNPKDCNEAPGPTRKSGVAESVPELSPPAATSVVIGPHCRHL